MARHSGVALSITLSVRNRRPRASSSRMKSIEHRSFGRLVSGNIGRRIEASRLRLRRPHLESRERVQTRWVRVSAANCTNRWSMRTLRSLFDP